MTKTQGYIFANTDTAKQAAEFAQLAARQLPLHRRVAFERAEAGAIGRVV